MCSYCAEQVYNKYMTVTSKVILTASTPTAPRIHPYFSSASAFVIKVLDGVTPAGEDVSPVIPHVPDVHVAFPHHSFHDAIAQPPDASTEHSPDRTSVESTKGPHSAASLLGFLSPCTSAVVVLIAVVATESRQHNVKG